MKLLIALLALLTFQCSNDNHGNVEATLRITSVKDSVDESKTMLLLTTIYENKTGRDIYLIKSYPWARSFNKRDSLNQYQKIPDPEFSSRIMRHCVNSDDFLESLILSKPEKRAIVDTLAKLNAGLIKSDYNGLKDKFQTQFLVLRRGERLEVDNAPVYASGSQISKYLFEKKVADEVLRRTKLGEFITIPKRIGTFEFWDGPINLSSDFIEIIFKEI
ncbi:hypothetical protein LZD49_19650 [Dyadobacter sp. CY261]|uniref:hypothetical protein n=1 Tax=Dyadobacter sp. CY261 TaxID=2907203 RepID=UPI001F3D754B|nr:hypothetical protein [Dyadobacter sp. CY261]MCF0072705.1 hypothetical protein [Dyadobacter sp. CY261]